MHTYLIKKNNYTLCQATGKHKAFEIITRLVKQKDQLGIWDGLKCVTDTDTFTIERKDVE